MVHGFSHRIAYELALNEAMSSYGGNDPFYVRDRGYTSIQNVLVAFLPSRVFESPPLSCMYAHVPSEQATTYYLDVFWGL